MKNKILLFVVLILSVLEVISLKYKNQTNFSLSSKKEKTKIRVKNVKNDEIKITDLEEYVIGVVGAEMPASFNEEALKAQAVASRTYALYKMKQSNNDYDVLTDISNQAYLTNEELKNKWQEDYLYYYERIKKAVLDTKGEIITYNDEVISAYYFAMSNGYTEDSSLVFKEEKPYLKSKISKEDENLKNFTFTKEFSLDEFCRLLDIEKVEIKDIGRSATGRVNTITIDDKVFEGTTVRKLLDLRSTDFDISVNNSNVVITTRGYGHGVGLSQYGANILANDGYNYKDIIKYYYDGVKIAKI